MILYQQNNLIYKISVNQNLIDVSYYIKIIVTSVMDNCNDLDNIKFLNQIT